MADPHSFTEKATVADADEVYGQADPFGAGSEIRTRWVDIWTNFLKPKTDALYTGGGASQLSDLSDVGDTTPTDRNALMADGDSWESRALVEADISDLGSYLTAETNDLTAAVTWANIPDANVPVSAVTQHQAALSITESQISDLGTYLTAAGAATLTNKTIDGDNNTISNLDIGLEVDWAAAADVTDRTAFASGDKLIIFEAGVGLRKIDYDDLPGAGGGLSNIVEDTTPQLGGMLDVNGNALGDGTLELLRFSETASAVNEITIANAATGNGPTISATGDDTNIPLNLAAKGTGVVNLNGNRALTFGAGEINALTEKATPVDGDWVPIEDSEDSNNKKKTQIGSIGTALAAGFTASPKTTLASDDHLGVFDPDNGTPADRETSILVSNFLANNVTPHVSGKTLIPILALALTPNTTNGAAEGTTETTTNDVMLATLDFDASTDESAQIVIPMPKSWNEGTITARFRWTAGATGDVVWGIQAVAISNDDAVDAAFGTAQTVTDSVTAAGDLMITAETSAVTIAGTPAEGDLVVIKVYRDADNGSDTLAADASLIAVDLFITTNATNEA